MRVQIPFTGPVGKSDSWVISPEECINMYLRPYPGQESKDMALLGVPGLALWHDTEFDQEVRGILPTRTYLYVVVGSNLIRISRNKVQTLLGNLNTDSGLVGMATNGLDIIMVDGPYGYVYDLSSHLFARITDSDFPGGTRVRYVDGYYLVNSPNSGQVHRSDYNNGMSWEGLAFGSAGANPDWIKDLIVDHLDLWLIGEETSELFYNNGGPIFNFVRIDGAFVEQGTPSNYSAVKANNAIYWIGQDTLGFGQVFQSVGRNPKVVSTVPVSTMINRMVVDDCFSLSYTVDGHTHIVFTFPTSKKTLVYDSTVDQWHSRSSRVNGEDTRWRANCCALFNRQHIVGDFTNGKLYELSPLYYDEAGEDLISTRISSITRTKQQNITIDEVELLCETGVGLAAGDDTDTDPQLMFSWSKNGGKVWSPEVNIPLGKMGEIGKIMKAYQLGQGVNWAFRSRISAAVKRVLLGAYIEGEVDV